MDIAQIKEEIKSMKRIELREQPFILTGLPWVYERNSYDRIPGDLMPKAATDLFKEIATECSGAIARIRTNSSHVYFEGRVRRVKETLYHMSRVGRSGFDFHIKKDHEPLRFIQTSVPYDYGTTSVMCEVAVQRTGLYDERPQPEGKPDVYELRIVLPTYNVVDEAYIYVDADAVILPPEPQTYDKTVMFYGSSITQGACASRPSNCYTNRLALNLDCPILNFGFSGHCMAEPELANLIVKQKMDIFVMDYDHNAPNSDYLKKTHQPFFKMIRKARPDIPVVFMTKPDYGISLDDNDIRRAIIRKTYADARKDGDDRVYFVDGKYFFEGIRNEATLDGCHPTDMGFDRMYRATLPLIKALLDGDLKKAAEWQPGEEEA